MKPGSARALGLLLGFAADRALGDPSRFHPVAGFGTVAATLERGTYGDSRARGVAHAAALVGTVVGAGALAERRYRGRVAQVVVTGASTWVVLGGRSLEREADAVVGHLPADLPGARRRLTHLVGRETRWLDEHEISRAVVESVAENTSDAVVAPLVAGAVFGAPGLLGHRAINTLDAMIGHRTPRYQRFGWAAARLDDLANLVGARLTAGLAVALGPAPGAAARAWRRDAAAHPSPNAGPVEAAFAGALGIRLGGTNSYDGLVEDRAVLGDGRPATPADVARATRLARRVGIASAIAAAGLALSRPSRPWPGRRGDSGPARRPRPGR